MFRKDNPDFTRGGRGFGPRHRGWEGEDARHHGRARMMRRAFEHGRLRLVILKLIGENPSHGYELIKALEEKTGGHYSPSPGVIYPTLTMLEELGYIAEEESEGRSKRFVITPAGKDHLAENQAIVEEIDARLNDVNAARSASDAPPIIRAMENVKMALRLRLAQGALSDKQVQTIAAALDTAALGIERA